MTIESNDYESNDREFENKNHFKKVKQRGSVPHMLPG